MGLQGASFSTFLLCLLLSILQKNISVVGPSNVYLFQDEDEFDPSR